MKPYMRKLRDPARELRAQMTAAESVLWQYIRRKQLNGLQFYRQKPLLGFIVDFYCPSARLALEIDGIHHVSPEYLAKDELRDQHLLAIGVRVLRFSNREIFDDMQGVLARILGVMRIPV